MSCKLCEDFVEKLWLPDSHLGFADRLLLSPSGQQPGNLDSMAFLRVGDGDDDIHDDDGSYRDDDKEVNDITGVTSTAAKARNRIEDDSPAGDDFDHDDGHWTNG